MFIYSFFTVQGVCLGSRAAEVEIDLANISLKFSGPNITSAIGCLALLAAHVTHNPQALLNLAEKCFSAIASVAKSINYIPGSTVPPIVVTPQQVPRIHSTIVLYSCLVFSSMTRLLKSISIINSRSYHHYLVHLCLTKQSLDCCSYRKWHTLISFLLKFHFP